MATKNNNATVWVAYYRFEDRHGDAGMAIVGVFDSKDKAEAAKAKNIREYLRACEGIGPDGKINGNIDEIDGETAEGMDLEAALEADSINVDSCGTWCEWDISEEAVG